jgi:hypothetical protein
MVRQRRQVKDARKRILRNAEDIVTQRMEERSTEELTRVGVVWSGILDLDDAIPPSEVAALLSAYDLVRATTLIDSEEYWTSAAAYAALGAYSEPDVQIVYSAEEKEKEKNPIGFGPKQDDDKKVIDPGFDTV